MTDPSPTRIAMDLDPMAESMLGDVISTNLSLSYTIDGTDLNVDQLSLDMQDLGAVGLTLAAQGVNPDAGDPGGMLLAAPMAASPATPAPITSTFAGGILPAAVICPVKKRPKCCAASTTAR